MRPFFKLYICFLVIALTSTVWSTVYYVSSSEGSNSNSGLSSNMAWQDLSKVHRAKLNPGDSVLFQWGSSFKGNCFITSAGTRNQPIVFSTYGNGSIKPTFLNSGEWSNGMEIRGNENGRWIVIENIHFIGAHEAGVIIRDKAVGVTVRNCVVNNCGGGVIISGDSCSILNNTFRDLNMIHNTEGVSPELTNDDYGAIGVTISGSDNLVENNRFEKCRAPSFDYEQDGGAVEFFGTAHRNRVTCNRAIACNGFVEIGGGEFSDNTISNNIADQCFNTFAFVHLLGDFSAKITNLHMDHNTIYQVNPDETYGTVIGFNGIPDSSTLSFRNNIVVSASPFTTNDQFDHRNNLYHFLAPAKLNFTLNNSEIMADPLFVNPKEGDFSLPFSSGARDAGFNLGYIVDYLGLPRTVGIAPDCGALEIQSTSTIDQAESVKSAVKIGIRNGVIAIPSDFKGKIDFHIPNGKLIGSTEEKSFRLPEQCGSTIIFYRMYQGKSMIQSGSLTYSTR